MMHQYFYDMILYTEIFVYCNTAMISELICPSWGSKIFTGECFAGKNTVEISKLSFPPWRTSISNSLCRHHKAEVFIVTSQDFYRLTRLITETGIKYNKSDVVLSLVGEIGGAHCDSLVSLG